MVYVRNADNSPTVRAVRAPNRSPNRPKKGPPINMVRENTVSRYPNIIGSTPSFFERNCKDEEETYNSCCPTIESYLLLQANTFNNDITGLKLQVTWPVFVKFIAKDVTYGVDKNILGEKVTQPRKLQHVYRKAKMVPHRTTHCTIQ